MKAAALPPIRVEPALRSDIEDVLDEGETITDFVTGCVRDGVAWRRGQDEFLARAAEAVERAANAGTGSTPEAVLERLDEQLRAARVRVV